MSMPLAGRRKPMSKKSKNNNDPDTEVIATGQKTTPQKAKRRTFSAKYKRRILQEYEACTEPGEKGALLRREGIYSSYITTWRRQRERGELGNSKSKKRGPKTDPKDAELSKLEEENKRLRERLKQAELIIEAQKKISQILGLEETKNNEPK
jgi:transposase-like protein